MTKLQEHHQKKINESGGISFILYPKDFEFFRAIIRRLLGVI